ncbi:MAG: hypothetical protein ABIB71_00265 [Candidatus Woesearchaeota archaeon]
MLGAVSLNYNNDESHINCNNINNNGRSRAMALAHQTSASMPPSRFPRKIQCVGFYATSDC